MCHHPPSPHDRVVSLTNRLRRATDELRRAVEAAQHPDPSKETTVPNATLDQLAAQVTATETVIDSAVALINGIAARIQAAVDAAIAGGATAADLAPVQQEVTDLQALSDAVAANTPPPAP